MDEDNVFKALADPTRRLILEELAEEPEQTLYELSVRLVMKHKVTMSRQAITKHIGVLENAGLLQSARRGKYRVLSSTRALDDGPAATITPAEPARSANMRIIITSIFVDDQDKALKFYTEMLGFIKKHDVPLGSSRWLTVVSPDDQNGTELLLEPDEDSVFQNYKKALVEQGIPAAMFGINDIDDAYRRLSSLGVAFSMKPTQIGEIKVAIFDDTCGNFIQIMER